MELEERPMTLSSLDAGAFAVVMELLPFSTICAIPQVSKTINKLCAAIQGGWTSFVESQVTRFRDGCKYASTPTGWINTIEVHTVCDPPAGKKRKRVVMFRMIKIGVRRYKVRVNYCGVEYIRLGPNDKYPTLYANSTGFDAEYIRKNNNYWNAYK